MIVFVSPFAIGRMSSDEPSPNENAAIEHVDLTELAVAWEGNRHVRKHFLESGSVVFSEPGKYHPSESVSGVGANFETLAPIAHKLLLEGEDEIGRARVGMVTIPQIEAQSPIYSLSVSHFCCTNLYFFVLGCDVFCLFVFRYLGHLFAKLVSHCWFRAFCSHHGLKANMHF